MRLTDIEKFISKPTNKPNLKQGTREVQLTTKDLVNQMKNNSQFAIEKLKELPEKVREELKPFFTTTFFKERSV
jgi:response regulator RpfG family c-di-GMP phosphodiesterase